LTNLLTSGIANGMRIRRDVVSGSRSARSMRSAEIRWADPVAERLRRLEPQELGDPDQRPPQLAVGVDHDAGALVGHRVHVLEDRQQIVGERNEIRQDHVVERLVEHDLLRSADVELELRMARARELDHAWAHVYAHAAVGVKGGQEITAAGAELELQKRPRARGT